MKHFLFLLLCLLAFSSYSLAQNRTDTVVPRKDTVIPPPDTVSRPVSPRLPLVRDSIKKHRDSTGVADRDSARMSGRDSDRITPVDTAAMAFPPATDTGKAVRTGVSLKPRPVADVTLPPVPAFNRLEVFQQVLQHHPYFNFFGRPVLLDIKERKSYGKEGLFYFLLCILLYYAFIRIIFSKYVNDLFTLFFRVTMRHQQIREQLVQSPLPSLMLNLLFLMTAGFYISLVAVHYKYIPEADRWLVWIYAMGMLAAIYTGKYLVLKIAGWIFNVQGATDTYAFIVFLVNKMIGILLLPVLILMAFAPEWLFSVILSLSYMMIGILFIYRFIISYRPLRNEIKINRFQFFMYLCAFEIAPLLLIYKVLLAFVERVY